MKAVLSGFNLLCMTDKFPELRGITRLRTLMVRKQEFIDGLLLMRVSEAEENCPQVHVCQGPLGTDRLDSGIHLPVSPR